MEGACKPNVYANGEEDQQKEDSNGHSNERSLPAPNTCHLCRLRTTLADDELNAINKLGSKEHIAVIPLQLPISRYPL